MLLPGGIGVASVTAPALMLLLSEPPLGCPRLGAVVSASSVVPSTVTLLVPAPHGARSTVTTTGPDDKKRRSAVPTCAGKVVSLSILNRRRVIGAAVEFVKVRRKSTVPKVEVSPGPGVASRTRFGAPPVVKHGSS